MTQQHIRDATDQNNPQDQLNQSSTNGLPFAQTEESPELLRWRADALMDEMMLGAVDISAGGPESAPESSMMQSGMHTSDLASRAETPFAPSPHQDPPIEVETNTAAQGSQSFAQDMSPLNGQKPIDPTKTVEFNSLTQPNPTPSNPTPSNLTSQNPTSQSDIPAVSYSADESRLRGTGYTQAETAYTPNAFSSGNAFNSDIGSAPTDADAKLYHTERPEWDVASFVPEHSTVQDPSIRTGYTSSTYSRPTNKPLASEFDSSQRYPLPQDSNPYPSTSSSLTSYLSSDPNRTSSNLPPVGPPSYPSADPNRTSSNLPPVDGSSYNSGPSYPNTSQPYPAQPYPSQATYTNGHNPAPHNPAPHNPVPHNPNGYNPNGHNLNGYAPNGYNGNGYSGNGQGENGYSANGYRASEYRANEYSGNGYSANGHHANSPYPDGYHQGYGNPNANGSPEGEPELLSPERHYRQANPDHDSPRQAYEEPIPELGPISRRPFHAKRSPDMYADAMHIPPNGRYSTLLPRMSELDVHALEDEIDTYRAQINKIMPVGHDTGERAKNLLNKADTILKSDPERSAEVGYYMQQARSIMQRAQQRYDWTRAYRNRLILYQLSWFLLSGIVFASIYLYQSPMEGFIMSVTNWTSQSLGLQHFIALLGAFFGGTLGSASGALFNMGRHIKVWQGLDRNYCLLNLILPIIGALFGLAIYLLFGTIYTLIGINPSASLIVAAIPALGAFLFGYNQERIYGTLE